MQRLASLDKEVEKLAESNTYKQVVGLLCCFHGIQRISSKKPGKGGVMNYDFIFFHQASSELLLRCEG